MVLGFIIIFEYNPMDGINGTLYSSRDLCKLNDTAENEYGDYRIPEGLKQSIIMSSREGFNGLILENQLQTFLRNTISIENSSQELIGYIYSKLGESLISVWDNISSEDELYLSIQDEEFIAEILFNALTSFEKNGGIIDSEQVIIIDGIDYILGDYRPCIKVENNLDEEDTLIEFLDVQGLPNSSKVILRQLFEKFGIFKVDITQEELDMVYHNLDILIRFIVSVESYGGKNIKNGESSSGKGPFQYLDGYIDGQPTMVALKDGDEFVLDENGEKIYRRVYDRSEGRYSPFDTALRRSMYFYTGESDYLQYTNNSEYRSIIPSWIINAYENQPKVSPLDLSGEQSINLWLIDSFSREKTQKYLEGILIQGNSLDMLRFYNEIHHTSPNLEVSSNAQDDFEIYAPQLSGLEKLIFSSGPRHRPLR